MYNLNTLGFTTYSQSTNYWRSTKAQGANSTESSSVTKKQDLISAKVWKIFMIVNLVLVGVIFVIQIYTTVMNVQGSRLETTTKTRPSPISNNTTVVTTVATTVATTVEASTVDPDICTSGFLGYGDDDLQTKSVYSVTEDFIVGDITVTNGIIEQSLDTGGVNLKQDTNLVAEFKNLYGFYDSSVSGKGHYHKVTSGQELAVIRCLVNDADVDKAHVFTFVDLHEAAYDVPSGLFQAVFAFRGTSKSYVIHNYGDNIPSPWQDSPVEIKFYATVGDLSGKINSGLTTDNIKGKRLFTDITKVPSQDSTIGPRYNDACNC